MMIYLVCYFIYFVIIIIKKGRDKHLYTYIINVFFENVSKKKN